MRVALLGASHWHAAMHAEAVLASGGTVCAVWDPDPAAALRLGGPAVESLGAALDAEPDLCVVTGHPAEVPDLARAVIEAGLPMILEKPAAASTEALREIEALARRRAVFVAVPLANRLSPALRHRPDGARVAHASFRIVNGPPRRYRDDGVGWVLDPVAGGGGALRNLGLHGVDSALSLARGEVRVVSAHIGKRLHPEEAVEDHALVTLADGEGALFTVEAGYTTPNLTPGGDFEWRIATPEEYLIDRGDTALSIGSGGPRPLPPLPPGDRYRAFMANTFERLREERPPLVGLSDYVAAMAVIDAAYAEARP